MKSMIDLCYESLSGEVFGAALVERDIPALTSDEFLLFVQKMVQEKRGAIRTFVADLLLSEFGYPPIGDPGSIVGDCGITRCLRTYESNHNRTYYAFDGYSRGRRFGEAPDWRVIAKELRLCLANRTMDRVAVEGIDPSIADPWIARVARGSESAPLGIRLESHGQHMVLEYAFTDASADGAVRELLVICDAGIPWFIGWLDGATESSVLNTRMIDDEELERWITD